MRDKERQRDGQADLFDIPHPDQLDLDQASLRD